MRQQFLNEPEDLQWLRDTHLAGIELPKPWDEFGSAVIYGDQSAPHSVALYLRNGPYVDDPYLLVKFEVPILEARDKLKVPILTIYCGDGPREV